MCGIRGEVSEEEQRVGQGRAMEDWYGHHTLKNSSGTEGEKPHMRPAALYRPGGEGFLREAQLCWSLEKGHVGSTGLGRQTKSSWDLGTCVCFWRRGCLHLFTYSLALSATLCVSLSLDKCLSNCVSACATMQVIHPPQPHAQGEGRTGSTRMC